MIDCLAAISEWLPLTLSLGLIWRGLRRRSVRRMSTPPGGGTDGFA